MANGCFLLFENTLAHSEFGRDYFFTDPVDIIRGYSASEVKNCFRKIEEYSKKYYIAGYFSYELGYCFEKCLRKFASNPERRPLIYLGVFEKPQKPPSMLYPPYHIKNIKLGVSYKKYADDASAVKSYLRSGDAYQVNYCSRFEFELSGSAVSFYNELKKHQQTPFSAFLKFGKSVIISLSPELFIKRDGSKILSMPMKGTAPRGRYPKQDSLIENTFISDEKNKAENLMIVDLIRNDFGRFSKTGSVLTEKLFEVHRYKTLFQMTSTVSGAIKQGVSYYDIFKSIFPCGSVTGAPKLRAMQIIRELEKTPRGVYCGAIGIILPGKKCVFSVPIRTVELNGNRAVMGVGSGIVVYSKIKDEYKEVLLKGSFLSLSRPVFGIFESILWHNGYFLLKEHLHRMQKSAKYFGYPFDARAASIRLIEFSKSLKLKYKIKPGFCNRREDRDERGRDFFDVKSEGDAGTSYELFEEEKVRHRSSNPASYCKFRVKISLDSAGSIKIEKSVLEPVAEAKKLKITIHKTPVDESNIFLYHKTTAREFYDSCLKEYQARGYYDVVFVNRNGHITEASFNNILVCMGSKTFTPPIRSGLLPGILRGKLVEDDKVTEKPLTIADLKAASSIFLCNSVRGITKVDF